MKSQDEVEEHAKWDDGAQGIGERRLGRIAERDGLVPAFTTRKREVTTVGLGDDHLGLEHFDLAVHEARVAAVHGELVAFGQLA